VAGAAVVNTSPLIFLGKLARLEALEVFDRVYTTPEALREVMAGAPEGHGEALAVQAAVERGAITIRRAPAQASPPPGLGPGELSVLALARRVDDATVVVDDLAAIKAARGVGLRVRSTPFILLDNIEAGRMDPEEFGEVLDSLLRAGYFMGPRLYMALRDAAGRL